MKIFYTRKKAIKEVIGENKISKKTKTVNETHNNIFLLINF